MRRVGGSGVVETIYIQENLPYPNHDLPVLYYSKGMEDLANSPDAAQKVKEHLENNGYTNSWVNGIFSYHHFHSNTHEVLVCISGEAMVQLGGPEKDTYRFEKGDVLLLPAGTAHKKIEASEDFQIIGAYPDGIEPDMEKGENENFQELRERIASVPIPESDPLQGVEGAVMKFWKS